MGAAIARMGVTRPERRRALILRHAAPFTHTIKKGEHQMANVQVGRDQDGRLSLTITDLSDSELAELIRVAQHDTRSASPAKARLMRYHMA